MKIIGNLCRYLWVVNQTWSDRLTEARRYIPRHGTNPTFMAAWNLP